MPINAAAVILYIASCIYIIRKDKRIFVFFAFLAFSQIWALVSCFYNDLGIYNIELFRFTEPTYATFRLAMLYVVFNLGFLAAMRTFQNSFPARVDYRITRETLQLGGIKIAVYGCVGLVIVYIAHNFMTGGIPVFSGFGRLGYFEETGRLEKILLLYGFLFAFILGYFRPTGKKYSLNSIILIIYLAFLILTGNKFSSLISMVTYYYAPIFAKHYNQKPDVKLLNTRNVLIALLIIILTVAFAFTTYKYATDDNDSEFASLYLKNRVLAFQGEMWWAADYEYHNGNLYDNKHWQIELKAILSRRDVSTTDVGMKYLMIRILGPEKAYPIIERGYLYTMTYPAILIAMFPYWIVIFIQFFAGFIFFIVLYYLYYSIIYTHLFRSIITLTILLPLTVVLVTGNLTVFFTLGILIKALILAILELGGAKTQSRPV
ncbi:MAG: DUF6418 domain-containing protein [candidate division Zixibacteria bacterium]